MKLSVKLIKKLLLEEHESWYQSELVPQWLKMDGYTRYAMDSLKKRIDSIETRSDANEFISDSKRCSLQEWESYYDDEESDDKKVEDEDNNDAEENENGKYNYECCQECRDIISAKEYYDGSGLCSKCIAKVI